MRAWKKCREHRAFLIGALVIACFYLWRIQYGNAEVDEAFYLTVPFRILKGDRLLTDEWHVTQLTGFLQTPMMLLQRLLFGGTEGVVLHFRAFWLAGHLAVMTLSYALLAQRNRVGAVAASWVYGLSVPFGLMSPGYYTMGVASVYLLAVLFYGRRDSRAADLLKGVLLAVLVLCNPYCLAVYAGLLLLAGINGFKHFDEQLEAVHVARWHLGIAVLFLPFVFHVLTGTQSLSCLLENIRNIFLDSAHDSSGFSDRIFYSLRMMLHENRVFLLRFAVLFLAGLCIRRIRPLMLGMIALLCAYDALRDARYFMYVWDGNSLTLFLLFGAAAALIYCGQRAYEMLTYGLALPVLYMLTLCLSSNQGLRAMLVGTIPAACMGVMFFAEYVKAHPMSIALGGRRVSCLGIMLALALAAQLGAQGYVRAKQVFWEYLEPQALTARMETGPLKGIYTQPEKKEEYERLCRELQSLGDLSHKKVACYQFVSMAFLIADCEIGAPSAWMEFSSLDDPRLAEYYRLNPENQPDIVFVDRLYAPEWDEQQYEDYAQRHGLQIIRYNERYTVMQRVGSAEPIALKL